jgi:hypothetical protein
MVVMNHLTRPDSLCGRKKTECNQIDGATPGFNIAIGAKGPKTIRSGNKKIQNQSRKNSRLLPTVVLIRYRGLRNSGTEKLLVEASGSAMGHEDARVVGARSHAMGRSPRLANIQAAVDGIGDLLVQMGYSGTAGDPASSDANAVLARAVIKLQQHDPEAGELFASVIHDHDVREGWLGLAIAHHFRGEITSAGIALAHALSRHVVSVVPPVANSITQLMRAPGWCALDGAGQLTVQLVRTLRARSRLVASIDGKPLLLHAKPGGRGFTSRLSNGWRHAREFRVHVDDVDLLGSPIGLQGIAPGDRPRRRVRGQPRRRSAWLGLVPQRPRP